MGNKYIYILAAFLICFSTTFSQQKSALKGLDDDNSKYTNVGNIGLSVSNFGVYGNALLNLTQPGHSPSCEYPLGSGIEHIFQGGLWVGGFKKDAAGSITKTGPFVTTGAIDNSSGSRGSGFEFTNTRGSAVSELSAFPNSRYYSPNAISHQDLIGDYTDTNFTTLDGTVIVDHNPLGISIHEENYAWNYTFANSFVIKNYTIKNISGKYLDSVYVGLWSSTVVRNTKVDYIKNGVFYGSTGDGYDDSLKIAYSFDNGDAYASANSYVGFLYLGSTPTIDSMHLTANGSGGFDTLPATCFNSWQFANTTDANFFAPPDGPTGDYFGYVKMQGWFGGTNRFNPYYNYPGPLYNKGINPDLVRAATGIGGRSELITHGYYHNIAPGDSINVVFAVVCADKYGSKQPTAGDARPDRNNLYSNADWALKAYFGNDKNRNGVVEPDEDIYGDGKIHRFNFGRLILLNPSAGLNWFYGSTRNITWEHHIDGNVKLDYSTNNGTDWITINSNIPASSDTFAWTIPNTTSVNCRIRISSNSNSNIFWYSDLFAIANSNTPPSIAWDSLSTHPDTTFSVMTFGWNAADINGNESITSIKVALNDTNNFVTIPSSISNITIKTNDFSSQSPLMDIMISGDPNNLASVKLPGLIFNSNNVLYVQAVDDMGGISPWISSATQPNSKAGWFVKKPKGSIALVNNYAAYDHPTTFYPQMMDSLHLTGKYEMIDLVNQQLPYLDITFPETVKLFKVIIWYTDNAPPLALAGATVQKITAAGVKIFFSMMFPQTIDLTQIQEFLPISTDTSYYLPVIAPNKLVSDFSQSGYPTLKVSTSFQRVRSFKLNSGTIPLYYFPNNELSGYIGFENSYKNIFFLGMPLNKMIGIPGAAALLNKVIFGDFNYVAGTDEIDNSTPRNFTVSQNYPNPFNPSTIIEYSIPHDTHVKLVVYDILGKQIKSLSDAYQHAGNYRTQWDGTNSNGIKAAGGIYIYRLITDNYSVSRKMVLLK